jgi:hypothetical protein
MRSRQGLHVPVVFLPVIGRIYDQMLWYILVPALFRTALQYWEESILIWLSYNIMIVLGLLWERVLLMMFLANADSRKGLRRRSVACECSTRR